MRFIRELIAVLAVTAGLAGGQTHIGNDIFSQWVANDTPFVLIDVRGDASIDSIVYPCFYVPHAAPVTAQFGCFPRVLVICHGGFFAAEEASLVVAAGYPADSVFHSGFDTLTGSRFPATDTLPLDMLAADASLPQSLSALQLMAALPGKREFSLIDVRTDAEVAGGIIPGACHYTWSEPFQTVVTQFDKTGDIILYCASGNRARSARDHLTANGFDPDKVINFGGFSKWTGAGGLKSFNTSAGCRTICNGSDITDRPLAPVPVRFTASPNPFGRTVTFFSDLPKEGYSVYKPDGTFVTRLTGNIWNGTDHTGRQVETGMYLVRLQDESGMSLRILKTR